MNIKHLPETERPVEKTMAKGITTLSNAELLAILIGSGSRDKSAIGVAEEVISQNPQGILYLTESSAEELMKISGIGRTKAVRILAAVELGKRISTAPKQKKIGIAGAEDIVNLFMEDMRYQKREIFKALLLNAKGEILSTETVSVGELTSTLVHPREVFSQAIKKSAAVVVFIHNHPSGDPTPSGEDFETTKMLTDCGKLLRINVLDHIIIGDGRFCSMRSKGYM